MIKQEVIGYHIPPNITYQFAETNDFIVVIPEERILATFYTVTRKAVGVCLVDVAIFGCLSDNRGEMLYLDSQQRLPAPGSPLPSTSMIRSKAPRQWPTNMPRLKVRASARPAATISTSPAR